MPNPFTRFLNSNQPDRQLDRFIRLWDALEERCIDTYQAGDCTPDENMEWQELRANLQTAYRTVADLLAPHWKTATIKGRPVDRDPFLHILQTRTLEEVIDNWSLLQHLPPAREAINRCILAQHQNR